MPTLTREAIYAQPLETVFAFFADAGNLEEITPPWLGFSIHSPLPIEMRVGRIIEYRLKLHRVPIHWRTEITEWDPPHSFVDEQRRGPYRRWRHEHRFEEVANGVRVQDRVEYEHLGGALMHRFFVAPELQKIFDYRMEVIARRFA